MNRARASSQCPSKGGERINLFSVIPALLVYPECLVARASKSNRVVCACKRRVSVKNKGLPPSTPSLSSIDWMLAGAQLGIRSAKSFQKRQKQIDITLRVLGFFGGAIPSACNRLTTGFRFLLFPFYIVHFYAFRSSSDVN